MFRQRKQEDPEWGRGRLLAVFVAGVVAFVLAICGLALGVYYSVLAGEAAPHDGVPPSHLGHSERLPLVTPPIRARLLALDR